MIGTTPLRSRSVPLVRYQGQQHPMKGLCNQPFVSLEFICSGTHIVVSGDHGFRPLRMEMKPNPARCISQYPAVAALPRPTALIKSLSFQPLKITAMFVMHALSNRKRNPNSFGLAKRSLPVEYFILANVVSDAPIIGHLAGQPIRETVTDASGALYRYVGVARRDASRRFDVETLREGEWIVQPGLVYHMEESGAQRRARVA